MQRGATAAQSRNQPPGCTTSERRRALAADQRLVLDRVGDLRTLDDPTDLTALAELGWNVLPHGYNSFRGIGMAVLRGEELARPEPLPGRPELLLYRPDPGASNVTDPFGADFPYELAGWGYLGSYDLANPPTGAGPCFTRSDWFVHERGIHDLQTLGFVPVPPNEDFHGQDPGNEPFVPMTAGVPHPRFWDMHVWLGAAGVPTVSMLNPGTPIPGIDPHVGSWFFHPVTSMRVSVRPRRACAQQRATFRVRVQGRPGGGPVRGARVRLANKRARTSDVGRASITVRLHRAGRYRVHARKRGLPKAQTRVRALRHRASRCRSVD